MHVGSTNVKLLHLPFVDVLLLRTILASIHPFMVDTRKQMFVVLKASRGCHHHSLTFTLSLVSFFLSFSLSLSLIPIVLSVSLSLSPLRLLFLVLLLYCHLQKLLLSITETGTHAHTQPLHYTMSFYIHNQHSMSNQMPIAKPHFCNDIVMEEALPVASPTTRQPTAPDPIYNLDTLSMQLTVARPKNPFETTGNKVGKSYYNYPFAMLG